MDENYHAMESDSRASAIIVLRSGKNLEDPGKMMEEIYNQISIFKIAQIWNNFSKKDRENSWQ